MIKALRFASIMRIKKTKEEIKSTADHGTQTPVVTRLSRKVQVGTDDKIFHVVSIGCQIQPEMREQSTLKLDSADPFEEFNLKNKFRCQQVQVCPADTEFEFQDLRTFVTVANACSLNIRTFIPVYQDSFKGEVVLLEHFKHCFTHLQMHKFTEKKRWSKIVDKFEENKMLRTVTRAEEQHHVVLDFVQLDKLLRTLGYEYSGSGLPDEVLKQTTRQHRLMNRLSILLKNYFNDKTIKQRFDALIPYKLISRE